MPNNLPLDLERRQPLSPCLRVSLRRAEKPKLPCVLPSLHFCDSQRLEPPSWRWQGLNGTWRHPCSGRWALQIGRASKFHHSLAQHHVQCSLKVVSDGCPSMLYICSQRIYGAYEPRSYRVAPAILPHSTLPPISSPFPPAQTDSHPYSSSLKPS